MHLHIFSVDVFMYRSTKGSFCDMKNVLILNLSIQRERMFNNAAYTAFFYIRL